MCPSPRWSKRVVEIRSSEPLPPNSAPIKPALAIPLAVQLRGGQRCVATPFIPAEVEGKLVEYFCPSGVRLLNYPNRATPVWGFSSVQESSGPTPHFTARATVSVQYAWYATN